MPFQKGKSGNPSGRPKSKQFLNMLNVALKDGDGQKLRRIADQVVTQAEAGEQWAIKEIADRLDGKPAQTVDMNVEKRTAADYTRDELVSFLANAASGSSGTPEKDGLDPESDSVH